MTSISYFVGTGMKREVRLSGIAIDAHGKKSQTSVFQSSDLLLVSWVREQIMMMDDIVAVDMFLIEKDESQKVWKQISMKQFRELLVDWRIKFQ